MPKDTASSRGREVLRIHLAVVAPLLVVAVVGGFYLGRRPPPVIPQRTLGIKCLVESVKAELVAAENSYRQKNEAPLFELKDFEMEINYLVRNSGGIKAEVIGVGTNLDSGSERVQKLRLTWTAIPNRQELIPPTLPIDGLHEKGDAAAAKLPPINLDSIECN